jgi:DNA helicase-2/ATP-dependent DNA helicase PcrA
MNPPSRFLEEIPEELCEEVEEKNTDLMRGRKYFNNNRGYGSLPKTFLKPTTKISPVVNSDSYVTVDDVRPGDMVHHQEFGSGLIVALAGNLATIAFKERGVKKMMLGVAPLTKV